MTFRYTSNTPVTYRVLPPKMRILKPEGSIPESARDYLHQLDSEDDHAKEETGAPLDMDDTLVSLVFGNQLRQHEVNSNTLAQLILNRRRLTTKHLDDIQWRINDLMPRRGIRSQDPGRLSEVEKQLIDLERQKRQVQLNEWRDLMELRRAITEERRQYHEVQARASYLVGGYSVPN
jgi:hypothetical protein